MGQAQRSSERNSQPRIFWHLMDKRFVLTKLDLVSE